MFVRTSAAIFRVGMAVLLSVPMLLGVTTCSSKPTNPASSTEQPSALEKVLRDQRISVRLDRTTLAPNDFSLKALQAAWEKHHESRSKNPELDFDFSVHCLDWARIEAFFEAMPQVSADLLDKMKGKTIYLNASEIQLCTASPYTADQIKGGMQLRLPEETAVASNLVMLKLVAKVDSSLALQNIQRAQASIATLNAAIAVDEKEVTTQKDDALRLALERLGREKRQRFNAAHIWRINAVALCDNFPDDAGYRSMHQGAAEAIASYAVPTDYIPLQN
jgi:hypothetical protein